MRPRKLGHAVLGSTDYRRSTSFFTDGLGFKISDRIAGVGAFMRCSTDHHNVLVLAAPVNFLHHTSWQVDDVDEVGRGAFAMLEGRPERHVWGLGRHYAGSNFFWYLKDPAGNFSEYYADMDCIVDDQLWTPGRPRRRARPVRLGPAAAAVLPAPRGPRGHDDRRPRPALTRRSLHPPGPWTARCSTRRITAGLTARRCSVVSMTAQPAGPQGLPGMG